MKIRLISIIKKCFEYYFKLPLKRCRRISIAASWQGNPPNKPKRDVLPYTLYCSLRRKPKHRMPWWNNFRLSVFFWWGITVNTRSSAGAEVLRIWMLCSLATILKLSWRDRFSEVIWIKKAIADTEICIESTRTSCNDDYEAWQTRSKNMRSVVWGHLVLKKVPSWSNTALSAVCWPCWLCRYCWKHQQFVKSHQEDAQGKKKKNPSGASSIAPKLSASKPGPSQILLFS